MFLFMKKSLAYILVHGILSSLSVARLGPCLTSLVEIFVRIYSGLNCTSVCTFQTRIITNHQNLDVFKTIEARRIKFCALIDI